MRPFLEAQPSGDETSKKKKKKVKFNSVLFLTFGVFLNSQINSKQEGKACLWFSINSLKQKKIFFVFETRNVTVGISEAVYN